MVRGIDVFGWSSKNSLLFELPVVPNIFKDGSRDEMFVRLIDAFAFCGGFRVSDIAKGGRRLLNARYP